MGWDGVKNEKLMALCIDNNFDVLLTIDKNLMFEQNLDKHNITIAVFNCKSSKIEELVKFVPSFNNQINNFQKHKAYLINIE